MRKTFFLILLISTVNAITSGQQIAETIILNSTLTGTQDKVASSWIQLDPGFYYSGTTGNYFLARAGQKYLFADGGDIMGGPEGAIGDLVGRNGVVGAITGSFSVSNTGAATYSIPIECPPGINGMTPATSLSYNSQAGNSVAGWGWNISGLSLITRSPNAYYFDNKTEGISWSSTDNYMLDGTRLTKSIIYPTGATMVANADSVDYYSESDPSIKIRGYSYDAIGPKWFKVWTSGRVLEYKKNQMLANQIVTYSGSINADGTSNNRYTIAWYLTSVSDNFGNKLYYKYDNDSTLVSSQYATYYYAADDLELTQPINEEELEETELYQIVEFSDIQYSYKDFRIKEITYSGNKNNLVFNYENRNDKISGYINGKQIVNEKRLSSISVLDQNGSQLRKYSLEYSRDSADFYSKLIKVNLEGENGESFNSTVFDWEKTVYEYSRSGNYYFTPSPAHTNRINSGWVLFTNNCFPVDFNGDGLSDFFNESTYSDLGNTYKFDWSAYINDGVSTSFTNVGYGNIPDNEKLYFLDRNLNGKTEIYMQYPHTEYVNDESTGNSYGFAFVKFKCYEYNGSTVARNESLDFILPLTDQTTSENVTLAHADFNGDGRDEFILLNENLEYVSSNGLGISIPLFGHSQEYFFTDFNGNGRQELVLIKYRKIEIWEYSIENSSMLLIYSYTVQPYTLPSPQTTRFFPGDFNGDGNTDILLFSAPLSKWVVLTSTGKELSETIIAAPDLLDYHDNNHYFVIDINQDGKSDIIQKNKNNDVLNSCLKLYISKGNSFELSFIEPVVPLTQVWFSGEVNNDLTRDFFEKSASWFSSFSISKGRSFNQINKIFTGIGQTIDITYGRSYSCKGNSESLLPEGKSLPQVLTTSINLKTVSSVTNSISVEDYLFSSPVFCPKGLWFMGFASVKKSNHVGGSLLTTVNHSRPFRYGSDRYIFLSDSIYTFIEEHSTNSPVSYTSSNYIQLTVSNNYPYKFYLVTDNTISYDYLNDVKVTRTYKDYDSFLFPRVIKTVHFAGFNKEAETLDSIFYKHTTDDDVWRIGELSQKHTIMSRSGEDDYRRKWYYEYYSNGSLMTEYLEKGSLNELKISYEYDSFGNILKLSKVATNDIDNRVREISMEYTPDGRFMTQKTDALNNIESYLYNASNGTLTSHTDPNDNTTFYTYDGFGRLKKTKTPDNNETMITLCWVGDNDDAPAGACYYSYKKTSGIAPEIVFYDKYGRNLRSVSLGFSGEKIYCDRQYDTSGRVLKESLPYYSSGTPLWKIYGYDGFSRLSTIINPDGVLISYAYGTRQTTISGGVNGNTQSTTKKVNSMGEITESIDNSGNSVFTRYYASGQVKEIEVEGQALKTNFTYDIFGNRTAITDPDAGTVSSTYNALGYLMSQTDNEGNTSLFTYDKAGRVLTRIEDGIQTTYLYDSDFKGVVTSISNSLSSVSFEYNGYGRIESQTETLIESGCNKVITKSFTYDQYGRIKTKEWSTGFSITYDYNTYGDLIRISNGSTTIWNGTSLNAYGQFTGYSQGQFVTTVAFDSFGELSQVTTPGVRDMKYAFDDFKNLLSREDLLSSQKEVFSYDNLNRLCNTAYYSNSVHIPTADKTAYYDDFGNITGKTGIAAQDSILYGENGFPPHAITSIWHPDSYSPLNQSISYTDFNKVETITDTLPDGSLREIQFTYGYDKQRRKSVFTEGAATTTKYFFDDYEEVITGNTTTKYFYIGSPTGLAGIYIIDNNGTGVLNYTFADHLGSLTEVVNSSSGVVIHQSFDAWGNSRSAADWRNESTVPLFAGRGFSGHEHLELFDLINMNGRMYDPAIGRFLSPDPYVQIPDFSQSFNRYSYCLNNPLIYTDPNGEYIIPMLIGAAIGVITNGVNNVVHDQDFFMRAGMSALIGGIGGAFSFGIGQVAMGMSGFGKIAFQTFAHGHIGGIMSSMSGGNYGQGFMSGAVGSLVAAGAGSLLTNASKGVEAIGVLGAGTLAGGVGAEISGGNFWDGARNGLISSGLNHGVHSGVFGEGVMMASITGKTRHLFGPDAIARTGGFSVSSGINAGAETGRLRVLRGDESGSYPLNDVGFGAGGIEGSLAYEKTNLYYSGAVENIKAELFYGLRWEGNVSAGAIAAIGYTGVYSALPNNEFVVGIGYNIGVGASPFILSININWGAAGPNGDFIGNTIKGGF